SEFTSIGSSLTWSSRGPLRATEHDALQRQQHNNNNDNNNNNKDNNNKNNNNYNNNGIISTRPAATHSKTGQQLEQWPVAHTLRNLFRDLELVGRQPGQSAAAAG
ncbi:unnamed protein product, partial [Polarella glacialis]